MKEVFNAQEKISMYSFINLHSTSRKDFSYHERILMKKYPNYYRRKYGLLERNNRLENKHAFDEVFF